MAASEEQTVNRADSQKSASVCENQPCLEGELEKAEQTIVALRRQIIDLQSQIVWSNQVRDALGGSLRSLFQSLLWRSTAPLRMLYRLTGQLKVGIDQLIPVTPVRRAPDGSWEGRGLAQFLIPMVPTRGWVRIRMQIFSALSTQACLYFDTGGCFNEGERFDLAQVAGEIMIDRLVPLRRTVHMIRIDPVQHTCNFSIRSFTLEPKSRITANLLATWLNVKKMFNRGGEHRPSILLGLQILFSGQWGKFHQQLLTNAGSDIATSAYDLWMRSHEPTTADREQMQATINGWKNPPLISVILPVYNVEEYYLRHCIESVLRQNYPHWELCVADDASTKPHIKLMLDQYAAQDARIKVVYRTVNGNISAASNSALELATGSYIALLDHDDELVDRALYRMAEAIMRDPSLDMIYSDEDKVSPQGLYSLPFFKPDWSPDYFLSSMYTCHLGVYRTELVRRIGGFRSEFDSAQDYDLVLRIVAQTSRIYHIPDVLYHWRSIASSTAALRTTKPESHERSRRALEQHLQSIGRKGEVVDGPVAGTFHIRYEIRGKPRISIIIPSACQSQPNETGEPTWMVLQCVEGIRKVSTYDNIEILILDRVNMPEPLEAALTKLGAKRVSYDFDFNWARVNNFGAATATGDYLLFLNDDTLPITPGWLEAMVSYAQWPEIGAVGARLLYSDGTLQHTGVCLPGGDPTHPCYRYAGSHPGHFYSNLLHRNWSAVTGACLMTRADAFAAVGGFDTKFPLNYNDVAFGLQLLDRGFRVVYTPEAELYHFESKTRKPEVHADELAAIHAIWDKRYRWDPYYGPNFAADSYDFRISAVPNEFLHLPARIEPEELRPTPPVSKPERPRSMIGEPALP